MNEKDRPYCPDCGCICIYKGIYSSQNYYGCLRCKRVWQFDEITEIINKLKVDAL